MNKLIFTFLVTLLIGASPAKSEQPDTFSKDELFAMTLSPVAPQTFDEYDGQAYSVFSPSNSELKQIKKNYIAKKKAQRNLRLKKISKKNKKSGNYVSKKKQSLKRKVASKIKGKKNVKKSRSSQRSKNKKSTKSSRRLAKK